VATTGELSAALEKIRNSKKTEFVITVTGTVPSPPVDLGTGDYGGKTITINGENGIIQLVLDSSEEKGKTHLLAIHKDVTLILENGITLQGIDNNETALVAVDGKLIMNEGAKITSNTNVSNIELQAGTPKDMDFQGGGVVIKEGGEFTMTGGEISENTTTGNFNHCGGVLVDKNAVFTMTGGEISGNSAKKGNGGGVASYGYFTMSGGRITGNSSGDPMIWDGKDYAFVGGGVATAAGSTFTMTGGEISGNTNGFGGGGVIVGGTFTMAGGEIGGNTSDWGGGIFVDVRGGVFTKTGGIIYGRDAEDDKKNVARTAGQAIYVFVNGYLGSSQNVSRNNTVGEDVNLSTEDLKLNWKD
jgi:hypothetical protein